MQQRSKTFQAMQGTTTDILRYYEENHAGRGRGGWGAIAVILGTSRGAAHDIAHGKRAISQRQAMMWTWWRHYQSELPDLILTPPCPSCGQSHNLDEAGRPLDCHNQTGQAVWKIVTSPRPPAPPRRRIDITALTPAQQDEVKALVESFRRPPGQRGTAG